MLRGCSSHSRIRATCYGCAMWWAGLATTRACASGCCTPCTSTVFLTRSVRITIVSLLKFAGGGSIASAMQHRVKHTSFDREVRDGLARAAEREHVELLT